MTQDRAQRENPVKAEHLVTFCVVAKHGSVSEAAAELGLSQPAVSRQLASLQRGVGQTLYERSAHGVHLTQAGHDMLPFARAVAQALGRARHYARHRDKAVATARLGLSHHLVTRYTGPLLKAAKRYREQVGDLELHLLEGYSSPLCAQVADGQLDAALVLGGPRSEPAAALVSRQVGEDQIGLLTLPDDPVAERLHAPLSVVAGETLVVSSAVSTVYVKVQAALAAALVEPGRVLEVSGPAAVRSAVLAGQGIGVTLQSFVTPEVQAGWLRQVSLEDSGFTVGTWWVAKPSRLDVTTYQVLDALVTSLEDDNPG